MKWLDYVGWVNLLGRESMQEIFGEQIFISLNTNKMLSYSQRLMLGNIINLSSEKGYQFKFFLKDGFVNIKFARESEIIHFDESNEKFSPAVRRYYFLRKIIKHFDPEFLNYK